MKTAYQKYKTAITALAECGAESDVPAPVFRNLNDRSPENQANPDYKTAQQWLHEWGERVFKENGAFYDGLVNASSESKRMPAGVYRTGFMPPELVDANGESEQSSEKYSIYNYVLKAIATYPDSYAPQKQQAQAAIDKLADAHRQLHDALNSLCTRSTIWR